jgi:hypothetical protein
MVAHSREVKQFRISPAGKTLLSQDITQLPLTDLQMTVLKTCETRSIKPGALNKIPSSERQALIQDLAEKGLIKVEKEQIKDVWLTELGQEYLIQELAPSGTSTISLNLFKNYVQFIRKATQTQPASTERSSTSPSNDIADIASPITSFHVPKGDELLQIIQDLDQEFNTDNYLPIFHLRQKLPSLDREELNQALYQLQRQDKIELSTLQEGHRYTNEQIEAGIRQPIGGPLFFIVVL